MSIKHVVDLMLSTENLLVLIHICTNYVAVFIAIMHFISHNNTSVWVGMQSYYFVNVHVPRNN